MRFSLFDWGPKKEQEDWRTRFDISFPDQEDFSSDKDVYLTTNENTIESARALHDSDKEGTFTYLGVLGGIDSSLTRLANIENPEKKRHIETAILVDVNTAALEYGQFRLDLMRVCKSPIEYLQAIIPAKIDYTNAELFADIANTDNRSDGTYFERICNGLEDVDFAHDLSVMVAKMKLLGYSETKMKRLYSMMWTSNDGFRFDAKTNKVRLQYDMRVLLAQVVATDEHWLSIKNTKNYQTVSTLQATSPVHLVKMPLQMLGGSALGKELQSGKLAPLGYVSTSNVTSLLGEGDFTHLKDFVQEVESAQHNLVDIVYGVRSSGSRIFSIDQKVAESSVSFADQDMRTQTKRKYTDIVRT